MISKLKNISKFKIFLHLSLIMSSASLFFIAYGFGNGRLDVLLIALPFFAFFWPITVVAFVVKGIKYTLKNKSIFELVSMAGDGEKTQGLMGMFSEDQENKGDDSSDDGETSINLGRILTDEDEEEEEEEEEDDFDYECPLCGKEYKTEGYYQKHVQKCGEESEQ